VRSEAGAFALGLRAIDRHTVASFSGLLQPKEKRAMGFEPTTSSLGSQFCSSITHCN